MKRIQYIIFLYFMNDEHVDIVNEADEVVGQTSKEQAHADGSLHRCVIAEIKSTDGRWALVKQAADRQDPGQYVSPVGGHVQAGEPIDDALKREALEEAGLEGFDFSYVGKAIFNREVNGRKENHYFIQYDIISDEDLVINEESVGWEWFEEEEIRRLLKEEPEKLGDAFHFVVKEFYSHLLR